MKEILNKFKNGIIIGFGFIFIVGIANSWTGLVAEENDKLLFSKWNELVNKVETIESNSTIGAVRQIIMLSNDFNVHNPSTDFQDYWNLNINNVQDGSKIIGELSISSLFEGSQSQERAIFKGSNKIASLKHKNHNLSGWGMHNPVIMFEDLNPNIGDNTYVLKLKVSGNGYFNYYGTPFGNGTSFAKLTEVKK